MMLTKEEAFQQFLARKTEQKKDRMSLSLLEKINMMDRLRKHAIWVEKHVRTTKDTGPKH